MDCAYVAHQRVFVANRPEDLAHYPIVSSITSHIKTEDQMMDQRSPACMSLTATLSLTTNSLAASCLPHEESVDSNMSPESSSPSTVTCTKSCRCIIDVSSTESLQRDFYNWLHGIEPTASHIRPCVFEDSTASLFSDPPNPSLAALDTSTLLCNPSALFCDPSTSLTNSATAYIFNAQPLMAPQVKRQRQKRSIKLEPLDAGDDVQSAETSDAVSNAPIVEKPKKKRGGSNRGTNLYGRAYCPGRPLSMDERYQIICLFQAGMKVNAISKQLCISHGCVSKIITRFRETGLLIPSSHAECRRRKRMLMEAAQQHQMNTG